MVETARIRLPDAARTHFDCVAEELVALLGPLTGRSEGRNRLTSASRVPPVHHFVEGVDRVRIDVIGTVDALGNRRSWGFRAGDASIGLEGDAYRRAEKVVRKLVSRSELRDFVSEDFVHDALLSWLEQRFKRQIGPEVTFVGFLERIAVDEVGPRTVLLPIEHLVIEEPFRLGPVHFDYFRAHDPLLAQPSPPTEGVPDAIARASWASTLRQKYQGKVYARVTVTSDGKGSVRRAMSLVDRALSLLRCFSPTAFLPEMPSYFARMGQAHVPASHHFRYDAPDGAPAGGRMPVVAETTEERATTHWTLTSSDLHRFGGPALSAAASLLEKPALSELETLLLACFELFARGLYSRDLQERLVFCLVALESLLLKDNTEPIADNLAVRLALLSCDTSESRRSAIKAVKAAYEARSAFLHHGRATVTLDVARDLQHLLWTALCRGLLIRSRTCRTKAELLEQLQQQVLSAPTAGIT